MQFGPRTICGALSSTFCTPPHFTWPPRSLSQCEGVIYFTKFDWESENLKVHEFSKEVSFCVFWFLGLGCAFVSLNHFLRINLCRMVWSFPVCPEEATSVRYACSYFLIDLERFLLQNCFLFPNSSMIADLNPPSWLNAVYGLKTTRGNYEVAWD